MSDIIDPSTTKDWQADLMAMAKDTLEAERTPGSYFGTKGGILSFGKLPMKDNEVLVTTVGAIAENAYYPGAYDPDNIVPPHCYAHGVLNATGIVVMKPHVQAFQPQAVDCASCPHAKYGTAKTGTGKGKACRNMRKLAVIAAGNTETAEGVMKAPIGYMRLAVYGALEWANYVKLLSLENLSPYQVVTRAKLVPDNRALHKMTFQKIAVLTDPAVLQAIVIRNKEAMLDLQAPYGPMPVALPAPVAPAGAPSFG